MSATPYIDITVVLYRSARFVPALVEGIGAQTYPHEALRLWFVDNAGGDGAAEDMATRFAGWPGGAVFLALGENRGFSGGNNAALRLQSAPYALLLNPDTRLRADCVEKLVARAETDPRAGVVEPRQEPREHPKPYDPETGETSWCSLGCALLRRRALEAAGLLDDLFFLYCEDVDLCWRLRLAGYKCLYHPEASYEHFTGDPGRAGETELFYAFRNQYLIRRIYGSPARAEGWRLWGLLRSWLRARPFGEVKKVRQGLRDGFRHRAEADARRKVLPGTDPWIGFSSVHLGPRVMPTP